jgi:hypothetical protein
MRRRGHAIMTAPFYSNPGLLQVAFGFPIAANVRRIEQYLPPVSDVEAILIGHAHYDHLMDAAYIAERRVPKARLFGNETMIHILAARRWLRDRVEAVDGDAGDWTRPGVWHYIAKGSIRFMALRSEHAPHFLGVKLFGGDVEAVQTRLPRTAYGWKEGQTLAFIIDFLSEEGSVDVRIHYQDAASNPPAGFIPASELATPVDVAILCVASFNEVKWYPEGIVDRLKPRSVVLGHWESFFRSPAYRPKPVPLTNTVEFAQRLTAALPASTKWHAAMPNAVIHVCPHGATEW